MTDQADRYGVRANMARATSWASEGAAVWVLYVAGDPTRVPVHVRSRGGRWIERWVRATALRGLRVVTVPPGHRSYATAPYAERPGAEDAVRYLRSGQAE